MASPAKAAFPPLRTRCRSDATVFSARRPPSPRPRPSRAQENRRTSGLRRWMPSALARPASCAALSPFAPFTGTTKSNPLPGCSGARRANQLCVNSSGSFFQIEHYDTQPVALQHQDPPRHHGISTTALPGRSALAGREVLQVGCGRGGSSCRSMHREPFRCRYGFLR